MKVILNQEEIVEAISDYLRDKLNLDSTASVEMSFTAGRGSNGYSASVDITYPKNEGAQRFTVTAEAEPQEDKGADPLPATDPAPVASPNLFGN